MLTDVALKNLRRKAKSYKVTDRDGMYVHVSPSGAISFRHDYRLHGRRETVVFGRYGAAGISLARAREKCIDARRAVSDGRSPAQDKQREKRRLREARSFGEFGDRGCRRRRWRTAPVPCARSEPYPSERATTLMASPACRRSAASIMRQSVRYSIGARPSRSVKRRAKLDREAPASRANSATVHRRAGSAWIASSARRSWGSVSANNQPEPPLLRSSI